MPIWSLTKERVEKLLAQIGDIEREIDTLIKLTKEDLWSKDLDEFINEWRTQLQEEANIRKKIASMGRRESTKLNINAKVPGRKRKAQGEDDDSDFGTKAAARKPAPVKRAQPKVNMLSEAPLAKPTVKSKPTASSKAKTLGAKSAPVVPEDTNIPHQASDGLQSLGSVQASDMPVAPIFQKAKTSTVSKKTAPVEKVKSEDEDDQEPDAEIIRPAVSRKPRQAAKKVPTYILDDSDSNGDDMLLDVGKMVKGIGNASSDQATTTRPLFSASMSRPGSSSGLPKKSSSSSRQTMDVDGDDTDYSKLAPPPAAKRGISVTARRTIISDEDIDDDDDDADFLHVNKKSPPPKVVSVPKVPKATATKPATQPKAKATVTAAAKKAIKPTTSQPVKKLTLSPAAKAYAAKRSRNQRVLVDTDDEEANEGDGEDEVDKVANAILDEGNDDDEEQEEDKDDIVVRRPARRAAAKTVEKVTKAWRDDSEEDQEEEDDVDDDEDSAMFDDDDESE